MQTAYEIGKGNAEEAIDQAGGREYPTLIEALDAYWENAGDTLSEIGARSEQDAMDVERGFADVLKAKGIAYRPHGMN